jgi:iron complex outermembrane receptor protein
MLVGAEDAWRLIAAMRGAYSKLQIARATSNLKASLLMKVSGRIAQAASRSGGPKKQSHDLPRGGTMNKQNRIGIGACQAVQAAFCLLLGALPASAVAQQGDGAMLEEITVTAERREQSLQDVPLAVTAFSGDMVKEGGITGIADIALQTPNFTMGSFNTAESQLFLRGIGSTNDGPVSDPSVAVFIDDVYIGRPSGASTDLYDLERIEVLRGPQGTLYGRNAAGGAVNIFTKKPQHEFEAKAGVTVGDYSLFNLRGYINGSISDTVAGKLTANVRTRDGYAENITTGQDLEDDNTTSVRGQLLFTPSDTVDVLLGFDFTDIDNSGDNRFLTNFDVEPIFPASQTDPQQAEIARFGNDPRKSSHDEIQKSEKTLWGLMARVDADLGWATLTSITSYRESEAAWQQALVPLLADKDGGLGIFDVDDGADEEAEQVSQEFRLAGATDKLNWVGGLYYFDENVYKSERFVTYWGPATAPLNVIFNSGDVSFNMDGDTTSFAAFGQFTWDISETVALTLGARYTDDEKEQLSVAVSNEPIAGLVWGIPLGPSGAPYRTSGKESWDKVTTRVSVDWDVTDDHMVYATYSEGFKSGSFNSHTSSPLIAAAPLLPEFATNREIGARTQWLDGRVRFNVTYFDLDYEDLQTWALIDFVLVADNAAAEVSGVETDFAVAFTENFGISGNLATLDGKFTEGANAGNKLRKAPELTWSVSPNVSIPLQSGASLDIVATASYTDEYHMELDNDLRGLEPDETVIDASVKFTSADQRWDLTLWGKNLGDELYAVHHIDGSFGGATKIWAPPRTYGISFNHSWE